MKYLLVFVCLYGVVPISTHADVDTVYVHDTTIARIKRLGNASVELANKDIEIELIENPIVWVQSENQEFDAYLNQGIAFLHVFHYIDALRSFKMAHQIIPQSLYPVVGMIFSYIKLSPREGIPFVEKLLLTSEKFVESASQREKLWYNLAVSVFLTGTNMFSEEKYRNAKPLSNTYLELFNFDPNDTETLTLATYMAGGDYLSEDKLLKAMEIQPHHIGANHYLVHFKERLGKPSNAVEYAQTLSKNASFNAHAVHMLAHILPIVGRWFDAKTLFEKADEIHLDWSQRNEVNPGEDWNYSHNLQLLSIAHLGLGEIEEGYQILEYLCHSNLSSSSCFQFCALNNVMKDLDSVQFLYNQIVANYPHWRPYLQQFMDEIALLEGASFNSLSSESKRLVHLELVNKIIQSQKTEDRLSKQQLIDDIEAYIEHNFPQEGFDFWQIGLLNSLRILSATARVKNRELYNAALASIKKKANDFDFDLYNHVQNIKDTPESLSISKRM